MVFLFVFIAIPANAYIDKSIAIVRIVDKTAGKTQLLNIPVGTETQIDKLSVLVRSCKQTDPFEAENFYMFADVKNNTDRIIFSGWMNHNNPGHNPLQNPDYDLWLVKCE